MQIRTLSLVRRAAAVLLTASLLACPALCQGDFVAIPNETARQYHFDFARNFFAGPEAEKAKRADYFAALRELESLKGRVAASSGNLLLACRLYDKALTEFFRHLLVFALRGQHPR